MKVDQFFRRFNAMTDAQKEDHDREIMRREEDAERLEKERAFFASGVPGDNLHCTFANYDCSIHQDCEKARFAVSEFVYSPGRQRLLVLIGNNGTGKTHLAAAAIRELGGIYRQSFDICAEYEDANNFRTTWNKTGLIKKYVETGFLVIDEIGRATDAKTEQVVLSKIITGRMESGRRTLAIGNTTFDELQARCFDNATVDRMNVYGRVVQLNGKSYRLAQAKK